MQGEFDRTGRGMRENAEVELSRFVIWEGADLETCGAEDRELLAKCLECVRHTSVAELNGINAAEFGEFGPQLERLLLDKDWGRRVCVVWGSNQSMARSRLAGQSINILNLSVRATNCLDHAEVRTIGDLANWDLRRLLQVKNMGMKSAQEILSRLEDLHVAPGDVQHPADQLDSLQLASLLTFSECCVDAEVTERLLQAGISRMDDLITRNTSSLRYWADLDDEELSTLQEQLGAFGLGLDSDLPIWLRANYVELQAVFRGELDGLLAGMENQLPAALPRTRTAPTCLEEELETFFKPDINAKKKQIVRRLLGWDGGEGATLEECGQEFDLTGERIRQIVAKSIRSLLPPLPHFFEHASNLIAQSVPIFASDAETALVTAGIVRTGLKIRGLEKTADYLGMSLPWSTTLDLTSKRLVVNPAVMAEIHSFCSTARRRVSHYGTTTKSYVRSNCATEITRDNIDAYCLFLEGLIWLDTTHEWFWLPTRRNTILNRLAKILGITQRLVLEAAHSAVLRDRRMAEVELPVSVFENLCNAQAWCRVEDSNLVAGENVPSADRAEGEEDTDEVVVIEILRQGGPFMRRRDIWAIAHASGVEKVSFDRVLSDSCAIVKPAPELYGLIGAEESAVFECFPDAKREPQAPAIVQLGEHPLHETVPTAPETGALAGCDPESVEFHEALLSRVFALSHGLRNNAAWSLMELGFLEADFMRLRQWGSNSLVSFRDLAKRELRVGTLTVTSLEAIALTFLAYSCEIARNLATEGELWPVICMEIGPALRRQIFVYSYPRPAMRDATESICSRLNIRHVFGREGEQSWLRTVFLQFGLTKAAYRRLPQWLGRGETALPVAIEMLLKQGSGLQSGSFVEFWQTLQRFRWQEVSTDLTRKALSKNDWVTHGEIDDLLACIVRPEINQHEGSEPRSEWGDQLIGNPILKWGDEPRFELPVNPRCPWLTEKRYALVLGNGRRISLTREVDGYTAGVPGGKIEVDLSEVRLAVDLQRGQLSCLPTPLSIELAPPDHDFTIYGPDGRQLTDCDSDVEPNRAHLLLCRCDCDVTIEPEEHRIRRVFGGDWVLRAYLQGIPNDLEIRKADKILWTTPIRTKTPSTPKWKPRAVSKGGAWGEMTSVALEYLDEGLPTHLIVGSNRIRLERVSAHSFRGPMILSANVDYGKAVVRLECEYNGRLRRVPATLQMGTVNGIAVETEEGWKVFEEGADMDSFYLQSHRLLAQVPSHYDGDPCGSEEWAWMEGDHFCGRPGKAPRAIGHDIHALGESLRLSVGPYNRSFGGQILARSVIHSGLIEWVEKSDDDYQLQFRHAIELGPEHALWVWREGNPAPALVPAAAWIQEEDLCIISMAGLNPIAFAISFQGAWLGSRTCLNGWHGFTELIEKTPAWHETAQWLKWWRVPLFHENLKSAVQARVIEDRTGTLKAWTSTRDLTNAACYSEDHADAWRSVTRHFLWDWRPIAKESAAILGSLELLTGDLELDSDRGWEGCHELLAIQPLLLIQAASRSLAVLYPDQEREDVQYMLEKLRNRILGVDLFASGSLIEKELARARTAAASALLVDELFISRSLLQEAERQVKGTAGKDRNLRVAIANSQGVRKYLAAAILDKMIRGEIQ